MRTKNMLIVHIVKHCVEYPLSQSCERNVQTGRFHLGISKDDVQRNQPQEKQQFVGRK